MGEKYQIYLPVDLLGNRKKIVLYAAGKIGKSYYKSIKSNNSYEIVLWVDKNWSSFDKNLNIHPITDLLTISYDVILVAIQKESVANEAISYLEQMGVRREKIVWKYKDSLTEYQNKCKFWCKKITRGGRKKIFLMNTPDHGNIGDHQIVIQELSFIHKYFPEYLLEEISGFEWDYCRKEIKEIIIPDDLIMITGGGYMGSLWEIEDRRVKDIISSFSNNFIVFLPQSFYYEDLDKKRILERDFYSKKNNIIFIHREKNSISNFTKNIVVDKTKNFLYPDMAFYLDFKKIDCDRHGILMCLRMDKERIQLNTRERIKNFAEKNKIDYGETSTDVGILIGRDDRYKYVEEQLRRFGSAKLVVTDRLHGMFFSFITETPCIALDNISKKVSGVYDWIKDINYVTCINEEELSDILLWKFYNLQGEAPKNLSYKSEYKKMAQTIRERCFL